MKRWFLCVLAVVLLGQLSVGGPLLEAPDSHDADGHAGKKAGGGLDGIGGNNSSAVWPMYGHDARHTGRSPYNTSNNTGCLRWKVETEALDCSPVIAADGTIYLGASGPGVNGTLYAFTPEGVLMWSRYLPQKTQYGRGYIATAPAIGSDGTLYTGTREGYLYAFTAEGIEKWNVSLGDYKIMDLAVGAGDVLYAGTIGTDERLFAVHPNGTVTWSLDTNASVYSPAIGDDGIIYAGTYDGYLYAIAPNGTITWKRNLGKSVAAPTVDDAGIIYAGTWDRGADNRLYAIHPNGTVKWAFEPGNAAQGTIGAPPAIGPDGTVYFESGEGKIYAVDPNGSLLWKKYIAKSISHWMSPVVVGNGGTVYVAVNTREPSDHPREEGYLYAFNSDGTIKWRQILESDRSYDICFPGPPAIGSDGTVYVGAEFGSEQGQWGYLYAFGNGTGRHIELSRPEDGYLYLFDRKAMPVDYTAIVIGKVTIRATVSSPAPPQRVTFYLNGEARYTDTEAPYEWTWRPWNEPPTDDTLLWNFYDLGAKAYFGDTGIGSATMKLIRTPIFL